MNNNTKIRLHLSKNLFESIAKEVLTEAKKANDGYTVAVKQPKQPKQSKDQAKSPEVQKTDAETVKEESPNIGPGGVAVNDDNWHAKGQEANKKSMASTSTLAKGLRQKAQDVTKTSGFSSKEIQGLEKLLDTILNKVPKGDLAVAIEKAQRVLDIATQNVKEIETNVAEEGQVNEFTGSETEMSAVYTMLATALGVGVPLATAIVKDLKKAKTPEEKKQVLQSMASQIDKSKGVKEDKDTLKEYEHHYEVRNGECRRYNDEGDYEVVSMHHCR